jgi:hypothetical protein
VHVATDSSNNFYVAENSNNRIRKIDTAGIITTVAGTGVGGFSGDGGPATAAKLNAPWTVTVDPSGNLYFADSNNRVRRLNLATAVTVTPLEEEERWVKASIQLPAAWDSSDIDPGTVWLQAIDPTDGGLRHVDFQVLETDVDPDAPGARRKRMDPNDDGSGSIARRSLAGQPAGRISISGSKGSS